jgi:hypothetical protein
MRNVGSYPWPSPFDLAVLEPPSRRPLPAPEPTRLDGMMEALEELTSEELHLADQLHGFEHETWDQLPKVKAWIDSVGADLKGNESLLFYVRFHPQPGMAILRYLHFIKTKKTFAQGVLDDLAAAKDINALLADIKSMLGAMHLQHRKTDAAFQARFEAEEKLREDVAADIEKIATWRRVRAYQVKAVVQTDKWRIGQIGLDFVNDILREAFPRSYQRIKRSEVPPTIYETIGWGFKTIGNERLKTDARFKELVERAQRGR